MSSIVLPDKKNATNLGANSTAIGIDLGTTYSCVGVWRNNRVEILANENGNRTTPSYVSFTEHDRVIGDAAKQHAHSNAANTVFDAKRLIGRTFDDPIVTSDRSHWPFVVRADATSANRPVIAVQYQGKEHEFSPEEISAMVLSKMKDIAEAALGHSVSDAVVTVPAYFNDAQRQATRDAGKIAGLNVMRIINEPTSAAIAYGMDKLEQGAMKVLIFDLGGGTLDVSVLSIDNGIFEVLSTAGDTHLGGEDFDSQLVEHCLAQLRKKHPAACTASSSSSLSAKATRRLRSECERAKRTLSGVSAATVAVDSLVDGIDFSCAITRARFEEINSALFRKCMIPVETALRDAKLEVKDIDHIVLVGGSSRIPKIQELLSAHFNGKELDRSIHPDEAVAHGAAVQAAILERIQRAAAAADGGGDCDDLGDDDLGALVLVDVTPLTLGIETSGGVMTPIVQRNSTVPITKKQVFSTFRDNQPGVTVKVFEGERAATKDNRLLGMFSLTGIAKRMRGVPQIEVSFTVDVDGILSVTAKDITDGPEAAADAANNTIKIRNERGRMTDAEIQRMVQEAEIMRAHDDDVRERVLAKGNLEHLLFHTLHVLNDEQLCGETHISPEERKSALLAVRDIEAWIEKIDNAADVALDHYALKHGMLQNLILPSSAAATTTETETEIVGEDQDQDQDHSSEIADIDSVL